MNIVIEEIQDNLFFGVNALLEDWVLDSKAQFHSISHRQIMNNYYVGDFGKCALLMERHWIYLDWVICASYFQTKA